MSGCPLGGSCPPGPPEGTRRKAGSGNVYVADSGKIAVEGLDFADTPSLNLCIDSGRLD
jgi:hypothetical protein